MRAIFEIQPHIEQIRKRLWCGREFGQAAVMIGAGFSKNANKILPSTNSYPLWLDLADKMYSSLYPSNQFTETERKDHRLRTISGGGALKLANEYETIFGRTALDELLIKTIPDEHYVPGYIHKLLLSLPWSDIFTTNYDTLLERTRPAIHERKYDLVLTPSDIPGSMRPRIVKLHGSFPSQRPFIVTEEDYRTYPNKFAPFVNLIQQSIMENVLCLIGFSGDDPNFLYWTGWVRDNLGKATPPIYLCGLLNLSSSQRRVLEGKNIVPIDLSSIFNEIEWPDYSVRHQKAIEWFLLNLVYGEPPNLLRWPDLTKSYLRKKTDDLPFIPQGPSSESYLNPPNPQNAVVTSNDLRKIFSIWRQNRLEYPGWEVAPKEVRERLWKYTEKWIEPIINNIDKLVTPEDLLLLYELTWRLEKSLVPLFSDWCEKITEVIDEYNPFPNLISSENASIRPDNNIYKDLNWTDICSNWVELVFALVREARKDLDNTRFRKLMELIKQVVKQNTEWQLRWFYEECLFAIYSLDQNKLIETLELWNSTPELPFWEVKRAAILAEINEFKDAEKVTQAALNTIRTRIQPYTVDYSLLSQEGWAMLLLKSIKDGKTASQDKYFVNYGDRWDKLGAYKCNPTIEIRELESILKNSPPTTEIKTKREFDPGRIVQSLKYYSRLSLIDEMRPGFAFLRLQENGAMPISCGADIEFTNSMINAATWISSSSPLWSLISLIRIDADERIKEQFDRVQVATLSEEDVQHLGELFLATLKQSIHRLSKSAPQFSFGYNYSKNKLSIISEIISRLSFRFSTKKLEELLELTIEMYKMPIVRQKQYLHDCIGILFQRIFFALPKDNIINKITELLALPIPDIDDFEVRFPEGWVEPFDLIHWSSSDFKLEVIPDRSSWDIPIKKLISIAENGNKLSRIRALTRLEKLYKLGALTNLEREEFARVLWSRVDENTGLPIHTGWKNNEYLFLPETEHDKAASLFRKYILNTDLLQEIKMVDNDYDEDQFWFKNKFLEELLYGTKNIMSLTNDSSNSLIDWNSEEIFKIVQKIKELWETEKDSLKDVLNEPKEEFEFFKDSDNVKERYELVLKIMVRVVLPRIIEAGEKLQKMVYDLIREIQTIGLNINLAFPLLLIIDKNLYDDIKNTLIRGIDSTSENIVSHSIFGIVTWFICSTTDVIPSPPGELLNKAINRLVARSQPCLDILIEQLGYLFKHIPTIFTTDNINSLLTALENLSLETELPTKKRNGYYSRNTPISIDERPNYRSLAARLAFTLYLYCIRNGEDIPDILLKWQRICLSDPLPEVKTAWLIGTDSFDKTDC
ncbi:SIR2 family protein [Heliobacterium chlorum]|uniref:SIR2 family protein n=1 Tax=Heliobacterium chlorum TaxID=2698 RepID=A0ABR7T463_HELCL|nr:SIR2 family protein [Heliobacterium chlorum]MBC9784992.1 SIR2 family protein [Heliobacterium chlorum]